MGDGGEQQGGRLHIHLRQEREGGAWWRHGREAAVVDTAASGSDATVLNREDVHLRITPCLFSLFLFLFS